MGARVSDCGKNLNSPADSCWVTPFSRPRGRGERRRNGLFWAEIPELPRGEREDCTLIHAGLRRQKPKARPALLHRGPEIQNHGEAASPPSHTAKRGPSAHSLRLFYPLDELSEALSLQPGKEGRPSIWQESWIPSVISNPSYYISHQFSVAKICVVCVFFKWPVGACPQDEDYPMCENHRKQDREEVFKDPYAVQNYWIKAKLAPISVHRFLLLLASTDLQFTGDFHSNDLDTILADSILSTGRYNKITGLGVSSPVFILFLHAWWVMRHYKKWLGLVRLLGMVFKSWAQNPY